MMDFKSFNFQHLCWVAYSGLFNYSKSEEHTFVNKVVV